MEKLWKNYAKVMPKKCLINAEVRPNECQSNVKVILILVIRLGSVGQGKAGLGL